MPLRSSSDPPPIPAPSICSGPQRIGRWTLHEGRLASQWVLLTQSFETLICRLIRDIVSPCTTGPLAPTYPTSGLYGGPPSSAISNRNPPRKAGTYTIVSSTVSSVVSQTPGHIAIP